MRDPLDLCLCEPEQVSHGSTSGRHGITEKSKRKRLVIGPDMEIISEKSFIM
ncbi:hypothetical protein [Teichococcus aestuarii]|uniref:hypothetical protein n=1 Tax=Teichococcus aestuarii TaxID=568898 RepID=UPI0015E8244B|nr:hypothetical protein [Pseudoroseomonas aestuarii]